MKRIFFMLLIIVSLFAFSYQVNAETSNGDIYEIEAPDFDFDNSSRSCSELLGNNLVLVVRFGMNSIRIIGVIVAIIMGMTTMLSVVNKGDVGEWNKAVKKCIWIAVVLVIVVMLPTLSRVIGNLFGLDTSCL